MKEHQTRWSVKEMCCIFGVSNSGYYNWKSSKKSAGVIVNEKLKERISILFHEMHGQMAGSPTITADLHDDPEFETVHRSRVAALMKEMGLKSKIQKKFTVTTDSNHKKWIADNL